MTNLLMSEELVGLIDENELLGLPAQKADAGEWTILMQDKVLKGTLVSATWDAEGCLAKVILRLTSGSIQDVLEGIVVTGVGFRTSTSEKSTEVNLGKSKNITHKVDMIDESGLSMLMTVTIHPDSDT